MIAGGAGQGGDSGRLKAMPDLLSTLVFVVAISMAMSILSLTGSLYMLQIYDRVLVSGSVPTLIAISVLAAGLFAIFGAFDVLRTQILVRIGRKVDMSIAPTALRVALDLRRFGRSSAESGAILKDVGQVRNFLGSSAPLGFLDLPSVPIFLTFVFIIHPNLGYLAIGGTLIICCFAVATEILVRRGDVAVNSSRSARDVFEETSLLNADTIRALGITDHVVERFQANNNTFVRSQTTQSDITGTFGALGRAFRMLLQSSVLGLAAYIAISGEMSAGAIIAATIASARAVAPIDMSVTHWKSFVAARRAYGRLSRALAKIDVGSDRLKLGRPHTSISVENLSVAAPGGGAVLIEGISFSLKAGQVLGLVGPTGSGKSTLIQAMAGIWPCRTGAVRLDGAELGHWRPQDLGASIGYVSQDASLFDLSLAENISRLEPNPPAEAIVAAARAAGVNEVILGMPDGYRTMAGPQGRNLSGGQRQRVALARALFGDPFVVLLDEPNANLDPGGEDSLIAAITALKSRGAIVIVATHRPKVLDAVDLIAVMQQGRLTAFGEKSSLVSAKARRSFDRINDARQPSAGPRQ